MSSSLYKDTSPAVIGSKCDSEAWGPSRTDRVAWLAIGSQPRRPGAGGLDREEGGIGTSPGLWQNRAIHAGVLCLKYARSAASGL